MRILLVALLLILLNAEAVAQSNSSQWTTAESADGHFSVRLPCDESDITIGSEIPESGLELESFHLGCVHGDQNSFAAMRFQYEESARAKSSFNALKHLDNWRKIDAELSEGTFKEYPILDVKVQNKSPCGSVRYILSAPYLFMLAVEVPDGKCAGISMLRDEFFSSLQIEPQ